MPSDKAELTTVRRLVYENLGITNQSTGYGNLATNKRYPSAYIDDAIAQSDIHVMRLLLKTKQHMFHNDMFTTASVDTSPWVMPQHAELYSVYFYTTVGGAVDRGTEVSFDVYDMIQEGGIFTSDSNYKGFYTVQDGMLYSMPYDVTYGGNIGYLKYIALDHNETLSGLYSPDGFEGPIALYASALLLLKRADNPEQANFYLQRFNEQMQGYMSPVSSIQTKVNE
jgi:hypothetical protein